MKDVFIKATAENWKKLTDRFNKIGVDVTTKDNKKYSIKLLLGTDAVHGDQHSVGNVLFPHNIGLSCSHNSDHFQNLGYWTKQGVKSQDSITSLLPQLLCLTILNGVDSTRPWDKRTPIFPTTLLPSLREYRMSAMGR